MILSGLIMNFMLYEKDYGLAIARLYCRFSLQMNVVKSSFELKQNTFPKVIERLEKLFSRALFISPYYVVKVRCFTGLHAW